ncbi:2OG-Fe(II) oxygenase [Enterovirga sp. GCM10030262]|uniref:2OG-Fe(II) oxygenase n=1 Tax=Enterovirga sp. GCM10030262 TaxID=3273391 RepID=UPI00360BA418
MFRLNPALDRAALKTAYARDRRVRIADLLADEGAAMLHAALRGRQDWRQIVNSGGKVFDLDRATRASMSDQQRDALDQAVFAGARDGFQHRYEAIRVPDGEEERQGSSDILASFASWLSGGDARDMLRDVTGEDMIAFADAQATAYAPGDFLTGHDDAVGGKKRLAAYVFGLTPSWRIEWGGLLLFHGLDGDVATGLAPRFNTLNVFAVPQLHSVSMVTRAAPSRRYSITGWLRAR